MGKYEYREIRTLLYKRGMQKIPIKKKNFKEQMRSIIGDDTDLITRIDNEELTCDDIIEIVSIYNKSYSDDKD
jgi:hypothetical protein